MFYGTKPVDWLLVNYLFVKVCLEYDETKYCPKAMEKAVRKYKPSLFQHMGVESSLKGKVQKLRVNSTTKANVNSIIVSPCELYVLNLSVLQEKDFDEVELFIPHQDNQSSNQKNYGRLSKSINRIA